MREIAKSKDKAKLVAEKLNIPEHRVHAVIDYYFSSLYKTISSNKHVMIWSNPIGTFKGSAKKTAGYIIYLKNHIEKLKKKSDFESLKKMKELEVELVKKQDFLEKILKEWDEVKQLKKNMGK